MVLIDLYYVVIEVGGIKFNCVIVMLDKDIVVEICILMIMLEEMLFVMVVFFIV